MKKKRHVLLIIVVLIPTIIGVAFAKNNIRLIVNNKEITPSIPLQIIKGEPVGSIRDVSEALGAVIQWDKRKQIITITDTKKQLLERKQELLENAFVLDTPEEVASNWAKGVMSRNGALQYALLCDELKKKTLPDFIALNWVTGTSSPWVDKFEISNKEQQNDGTWKFTIMFHYTDSVGSSICSTSSIIVGKNNIGEAPLPICPPVTENKWCIRELPPLIEADGFLLQR